MRCGKMKSAMKKLMNIIIKVCSIVTNFASSPVLFVLILLWLVVLYAFLPIVGYQAWNAGIGLFGNTNGSNFELITGAGAMVMLGIQAKAHKKHTQETKARDEAHQSELQALHAKVDQLLRRKGGKS